MSILQERLAARLQELGLKPQTASLKAGLGKDAARNILRGASTHGRADTLIRLARVLECSVAFLLGEEDELGTPPVENEGDRLAVRVLPVRYEVGAGVWVDVEYVQDFFGTGVVAPDPAYSDFPQWLELVRGDSVNEEFPDGTLIHVVDAVAIRYAPQHGDFVVLSLTRHGGREMQRTVKEVKITRGKVELWPRSTNPRWNKPIVLEDQATDGQEIQIEIAGLVLGSYRPTRRR